MDALLYRENLCPALNYFFVISNRGGRGSGRSYVDSLLEVFNKIPEPTRTAYKTFANIRREARRNLRVTPPLMQLRAVYMSYPQALRLEFDKAQIARSLRQLATSTADANSLLRRNSRARKDNDEEDDEEEDNKQNDEEDAELRFLKSSEGNLELSASVQFKFDTSLDVNALNHAFAVEKNNFIQRYEFAVRRARSLLKDGSYEKLQTQWEKSKEVPVPAFETESDYFKKQIATLIKELKLEREYMEKVPLVAQPDHVIVIDDDNDDSFRRTTTTTTSTTTTAVEKKTRVDLDAFNLCNFLNKYQAALKIGRDEYLITELKKSLFQAQGTKQKTAHYNLFTKYMKGVKLLLAHLGDPSNVPKRESMLSFKFFTENDVKMMGFQNVPKDFVDTFINRTKPSFDYEEFRNYVYGDWPYTLIHFLPDEIIVVFECKRLALDETYGKSDWVQLKYGGFVTRYAQQILQNKTEDLAEVEDLVVHNLILEALV